MGIERKQRENQVDPGMYTYSWEVRFLRSLLDHHNETLLTSKQLKEVFRNILNPESSL